jgi:hypothetical protein
MVGDKLLVNSKLCFQALPIEIHKKDLPAGTNAYKQVIAGRNEATHKRQIYQGQVASMGVF